MIKGLSAMWIGEVLPETDKNVCTTRIEEIPDALIQVALTRSFAPKKFSFICDFCHGLKEESALI
jgi:hypothetical protein